MKKMMSVFDEYNKKIYNKCIFTKVAKDNIHIIRNIEKNGYIVTYEFEDERGLNLALFKKL